MADWSAASMHIKLECWDLYFFKKNPSQPRHSLLLVYRKLCFSINMANSFYKLFTITVVSIPASSNAYPPPPPRVNEVNQEVLPVILQMNYSRPSLDTMPQWNVHTIENASYPEWMAIQFDYEPACLTVDSIHKPWMYTSGSILRIRIKY